MQSKKKIDDDEKEVFDFDLLYDVLVLLLSKMKSVDDVGLNDVVMMKLSGVEKSVHLMFYEGDDEDLLLMMMVDEKLKK